MIRRLHLAKFAVQSTTKAALNELRLCRGFQASSQDREQLIQAELDRLLGEEDPGQEKSANLTAKTEILKKTTPKVLKLSRKQAISAEAMSKQLPLIDPPQLGKTLTSMIMPKEPRVNQYILEELSSVKTEEALIQFATSNTDLLDGPTRLAVLSKIYEVFKIKKRAGSAATLDEYLASPNVSSVFRAI